MAALVQRKKSTLGKPHLTRHVMPTAHRHNIRHITNPMIYQWILYGAGGFVAIMLLLRLVTQGKKPFKTRLLITLLWAVLAAGVAWLSLKVSLGFALMMLVLAIPLWRGWVDQLGFQPPSPLPVSGRTARIQTTYLDVLVNQDNGAIQAKVLKGELKGYQLHELDKQDLQNLHSALALHDNESCALLERWLDKHGPPHWRHEFKEAERSSEDKNQSANRMTRAQALEILGLPEGAKPDDIKQAHKRLMLKNHPDQGGSTFLAAQINRAKDELLDK